MKMEKKKEIKSGVYSITNKLNGKQYIGSSKDIYKRWKQHVNDLDKGKHHSIKLQRAWDKYGKTNFEFDILEDCQEDKRVYIEQYYIDKCDSFYSGYNCNKDSINFDRDNIYIDNKDEKEDIWDKLKLLNNVVIIDKSIKKMMFRKTIDINILKNFMSVIDYLIVKFADIKEKDSELLFRNILRCKELNSKTYRFSIYLEDLHYEINFDYNYQNYELMFVYGTTYYNLKHCLDVCSYGMPEHKAIMTKYLGVKLLFNDGDIISYKFNDDDMKLFLANKFFWSGLGEIELLYKDTNMYDDIMDYHKRTKQIISYTKVYNADSNSWITYDSKFLYNYYKKSYDSEIRKFKEVEI